MKKNKILSSRDIDKALRKFEKASKRKVFTPTLDSFIDNIEKQLDKLDK